MLRGIVKAVKWRLNRENVYSAAAYWDWKATNLDDSSVSQWPNKALNAHYRAEHEALIAQAFGELSGKTVLEVGCGTGRISRYLAGRGARVTGVDFSANSIELARKASEGDNPSYRVQSVFDLADEGAYDLVVCWGVLTVACRNAGELLTALQGIRRALRPDGRLFLVEPIHRGPLHRVLNLSEREFCDVLVRAGFEVKSVEHMHFWPMRIALAYLPIPKPLTDVGYHAGQAVFDMFGKKRFGDYKAIDAVLGEPR
ncbi:hypothetical protein BH11MYX4_BH11MYX4_04640 [soil metagenome]